MRDRIAPLVYVDDIDTPVLGQDDAHHLFRVRRLRVGATVWVGDGRGAAAKATVADVGKACLETGDIRVRTQQHEPRLGVALLLPKGDRLSWAVQKLTEVGIDDIFLLVDSHDRRGGQVLSTSGVERLRRVARAAGRQSERLWLPSLQGTMDLATFLGSHGGNVALLDPDGQSPTTASTIWLVGPESGVIPGGESYPRISLGEQILRVETAAAVGGALMVALRAGVVVSTT
ncbi:MAG: 16S rRNA (uracil(1498)-N(3))-methyltransferase [Ferrimicrobium sp.]